MTYQKIKLCFRGKISTMTLGNTFERVAGVSVENLTEELHLTLYSAMWKKVGLDIIHIPKEMP